jgi:drug/metabolite transporter (DMT)-like permease
MSGGTLGKMHVLRLLAVLLGLLGVVLFVLESHNFVIRSFGLLAILASVQLVRVSRALTPSYGRLDLPGSNRPGRIMWFVGIGLLPLAVFSFWLLHIDALHGGHAVWPVFVFAGVVLAGAGVWGYIIAKLNA